MQEHTEHLLDLERAMNLLLTCRISHECEWCGLLSVHGDGYCRRCAMEMPRHRLYYRTCITDAGQCMVDDELPF